MRSLLALAFVFGISTAAQADYSSTQEETQNIDLVWECKVYVAPAGWSYIHTDANYTNAYNATLNDCYAAGVLTPDLCRRRITCSQI